MESKKKKPSIAYVMGFMGISGGNRIIYEHANRLANQGLEVYLLHLNDGKDKGWFEINPKVKILPFKRTDRWIDKLDMAIATFNETLWNIIDLPSSIKKAYLVQSDERHFYEKDSLGEYLCNMTYSFKNVFYITTAQWMRDWLKDEFDIKAPVFRPQINKKKFYYDPDPELESKKDTVLIEGDAANPRKGVGKALKALQEVDCMKWLLTNTPKKDLPEYTQNFDKVFSKPSQDRIRQLYSSASILLKPSEYESVSLPVLEAMACKCPVITTITNGTKEYCVNGENCLLIKVGDEKGMKSNIEKLLADKGLREKLQLKAQNVIKKDYSNWDGVTKSLAITIGNKINVEADTHVYTTSQPTRKIFENEYCIKHQQVLQRITQLEETSLFRWLKNLKNKN